MSIKKYKPITNGLRLRVVVKDNNLWSGSSYKNLTKGKKSIDGRNHSGKITIYHRGGGHKRKYRIINWNSNIGEYNEFSVVRIEYDPNRSGNIALCKTKNNKYFYILAPHGLQESSIIFGRNSNNPINYQIGSTLLLSEIPIGSMIYNVDNKFARSAGVSCELLKISDMCTVRLPSKKIISLSKNSLAMLGRVSNINHNNIVKGKAGVSRWLGRMPIVRGVAKNPIDHPHGGKTPVSGGRGGAHKTKWGKLAKWNKKK